MPCVATDGGINGLRPWCDANPTCIGYAVEEDVQQVWFKAAAALDYHGMDPSFCPQGGLPPPAGTGNCPYGPHTGKGVTDAGGLYIKCQVSTAACQRSFLAGLFRLHGAVLQNKTQSGFQCTGKAGLYQCVPSGSAGGNGTAFPEKQLCLEQCKAPPPPPPGPPPPAPHYDKPYLRFAMVIPVPQMVDCTVTQGAVTHTWSAYGFGDFSSWITTFAAASATVTIASGGKTLLSKTVTLTPGPLVIALRPDNVPVGHNWPPTATSIETIAASYVPTQSGTAGVRLFNLSPVSPRLNPVENSR